MEKDWRLTFQRDYLMNKKIIKNTFTLKGQRDHAHCAFCWEKFGEDEDAVQKGYSTPDEYYWICEQCFHDFKEMFCWEIEE